MEENGSCLNKKSKLLPVTNLFELYLCIIIFPGVKYSVKRVEGSSLPCRAHGVNVT